jgi:hypothetical protein
MRLVPDYALVLERVSGIANQSNAKANKATLAKPKKDAR